MVASFGSRFHSARVRPFLARLGRLPLGSRLILAAMLAASLAGLFSAALRDWATLTPSRVSILNLRPLSTYPFVHKSIFHLGLNLFGLVQLLDRFEVDTGTLPTVLLFTGSFASMPGALYTLSQKYIFHSDVPVLGASGWAFLMLAAEARRASETNPFFHFGTYKIPTWSLPLVLILATHYLVPGSSLTGHLFSAGAGYIWSYPHFRFIFHPPEWLLRLVEDKLQLTRRLPGYVSLDRTVHGRYGLHPARADRPSSSSFSLLPLGPLGPAGQHPSFSGRQAPVRSAIAGSGAYPLGGASGINGQPARSQYAFRPQQQQQQPPQQQQQQQQQQSRPEQPPAQKGPSKPGTPQLPAQTAENRPSRSTPATANIKT